MKKILCASLLLGSSLVFSQSNTKWVTVDNSVLKQIRPSSLKGPQALFSAQGASVVQLSQEEIEKMSALIHDKLHRCGGFVTHDSFEEAQEALSHQGESLFAQKAIFDNYELNQGAIVRPLVQAVSEPSIRDMIIKLSTYKTRYYKSKTGVESSTFIKDTWEQLSKHRSDVKVELVQHKDWPQPSIVMTIQGSSKASEIVVLGGHADSIAGFFGGGGRAPGADDNASGIATITEVIKVLMASNFKPERTIQFMGYAAEEVGLLGSKEIASSYKSKAQNVIGVMQLDMTLRKGTKDKDIVMMSDFTNAAQNEFLGRLIDEYVKVPWGYSKCGYGCSDHASWTAKGYPASIPFESTMEDINHNIHTEDDTLANAGGDAKHAAKFAKLAAAFVVELAN